jgi:glycosyltransferase involved in cell wall biosynthesis
VRVLHVVESFGGGVFEMVRVVAGRLAEGGDEQAIAYGRRPETPDDVRERIDPAVELFALPWLRRRPADQVRAGRAVRRIVAELAPDVVHLHSSFAGVVGTAALHGGAPLVYTPHGYSFTMRDQGRVRPALYRAVERRVARRVQLVGAVSETEAAAARQLLGAPRVEVVRNGIPDLDPDGIPPAAAPERPRVICMGRVDEARRPPESARILRAVADIADVAWVGGGGRRAGAAGELESTGIRLTGWLDRPAALGWLGRTTAYLHWAAWDGQPLAVLEAMARDVVVVASDIAPLRELLGEDGVCATAEDAIARLRRVLTDPGFRDQELARQRELRGRYGADRMVAEWRRTYRALAAGPGHPSRPAPGAGHDAA